MPDINAILEKTSNVPAWTTPAERSLLAELAGLVEPGGRILEIGALYGGMTTILALANPAARILTVDNFSWHPIEGRMAGRDDLEETLKALGISNVQIQEGDSREIGKEWTKPIDLLWIDGGHSYEFVFSDLTHFGAFAKVIALHDYDNSAWPSIRNAVEDFLFVNQVWKVDRVVDSVAVLRRPE